MTDIRVSLFRRVLKGDTHDERYPGDFRPIPLILLFLCLTSLRNEMDLISLLKAGGWASVAVMRRYVKHTEADVETAMEKLSPVDNLRG